MSNDRLQKLIEKRDQINARIEKARAVERTKERKADTRRKIIAGALVLAHADNHPSSAFARELRQLLDKSITKPKERELFGLPNISIVPEFPRSAEPD